MTEDGRTRPLTCFSPSIRGGYASITAGAGTGRDAVGIQMDFLSGRGTHTCHVPGVEIDLHQGIALWSSFRVRNGQFGSCTITQKVEHGKFLWKGHAEAELVQVKGNVKNGSPSKLHSEKDASGKPLTQLVQLDWVFDKQFVPQTGDPRAR